MAEIPTNLDDFADLFISTAPDRYQGWTEVFVQYEMLELVHTIECQYGTCVFDNRGWFVGRYLFSDERDAILFKMMW